MASTDMLRDCPICGSPFSNCSPEFQQHPPTQFDGGALSEVLAGITVTEFPAPVSEASTLSPCGCRVPVADWQLCQVPGDRWFARPGDVERTIMQAMAKRP